MIRSDETLFCLYFIEFDSLLTKVRTLKAVVVAVWVRALAPQGLVFESQPRYTLLVKTGSDSSTAKRSAIAVCLKSSEITIK